MTISEVIWTRCEWDLDSGDEDGLDPRRLWELEVGASTGQIESLWHNDDLSGEPLGKPLVGMSHIRKP